MSSLENTSLNEVAEATAASWATRLDAGALTSAEEHALQAWLTEDTVNRARLDSYLEIYGRLDLCVPELVERGLMVGLAPSRRPVRTAGRWPRFLVAAVGVAAVLTVAAIWWRQRAEEFITHVANRQAMVLADGTKVDLNAQSSLSVQLRANERLVRLDHGEVYFAVAKDAFRPFFVKTAAGTIRVTGTSFNVRALVPGALEVTVLEGSVDVTTPAGEQHQLAIDDQLVVSGAAISVARLSEGEARDLVAWREGRVIFESERLDRAAAYFARYHGKIIEIAPELAREEIGGRFRLDDLDSFLADVASVLHVEVKQRANRIQILPRHRPE